MHGPTHARRATCVLAMGALAFVCAVIAATMPATGATSGTVVGATVPSAIALDDAGCRASSALDLGSVTAGSWLIGSACSVQFGSSNDTARIKLFQRDETGSAMESTASSWTPRSGSASWNALATGTTPGTAWAGGAGGPGEAAVRFERTTDTGASWTPLPTCNGNTPIDLDAFSDTAIWMASSARICHSTDGGATWTNDFTASIAHMKMISPTLGYAVGGGNHVYRTTDGTNWNDLGAIPTFTYAAAVHATAGGTIVVAARTSTLPNSSFGVVWSTDNGATWSSQTFNTSAGVDTSGTFGALAVSNSTMIASGPRMGTYRSTDSGATWNQVTTSNLIRVPFVRSDGVIIAAVGGDNALRSADNGATWTTIPYGTGYSIHTREVAGNGLTELWAAGYSDRRLSSTNAGSTWTSMSPPKPGWTAVAAWKDSTWVVAGTYGAAVRTTNSGATLTTVGLGSAASMTDAVTWAGGTGVIVGANAIQRTTDYGATWSSVTPPAAGETWTEVTLDDVDVAWIVSSTGKVGKSVDRGATWTIQTAVPGTPILTAVSVWRGQIWVGATAGQVWRSSTAGALSWSAVPTGQSMTVSSIWAIDATTAVALTDYEAATDTSHVSRTADSGATWTADVTSSIKHTRDLAVDDGHRFAWITGSANIARSDDRGVTWGAAASTGVSQYIQRVQPLNSGRLLAVGDASLISISSPTTSIPDGVAGASGFGACLETATGTNANDWVVAGAGNCTSALTGNWTSIAADASGGTARIATTATGGTGVLNLRFGLRTGTTLTPGAYAANLVFEAAAPAV